MAIILSINVSRVKGTAKRPVPEADLDEYGVVGDAHAGTGHRQVSLLSRESIERFSASTGRCYGWGDFAENVTTEGLDLSRVGIRDRLLVGVAELEVTQVGKACHGGECAIFRSVGRCVMPQEGVFARVIRGGHVRPGDPMEHRPVPLRIDVVTLSDRACRGEYEDRSGTAIADQLAAYFSGSRWKLQVRRRVLPDDPQALRQVLTEARLSPGTDILFTTGGTGLGARDITPDVVLSMLDKTLPGIMEFIRVKSGETFPAALLSRGVAGVMGTCLVYTLPGSVRAVHEYLHVILPTLEHSLFMLWGLDVHSG